MQRPRCGNPDLGTVLSIRSPVNVDQPDSSHLTQGRSSKVKQPEKYVTQSNSWPQKHLKWFIEEYPKEQNVIKSEDHVRRILHQAFHDWEKYSGLKFEMAKDKKSAHLKIKFSSKDHGDGYPFDGQGQTLAHAFYPTGGDIHFDDDERFTDDYKDHNEQYTLRLVAAHEIGHALGLAHSYKEDSLMFPVYQPFQSNYNISKDDQDGIQALYGKPEDKTTIEPTKTTTVSTHSPDQLSSNNWCSGGFDTGCEGPDGELYLFNDDQVWRYRAKTKRSWDREPTLISQRFPSLPDSTITACVKSTTGYTYLFRNYRLWKLRTHWSVDGPHILHGKHYPQNPRVALAHKNSIYLVRDHLIYRLNEFDYDRELEIGTIDSILKPPPDEHIQSGFTYDKRHYIFTRDEVYVYDSTHGKLLPGYPKSATNGWFACEKASQASNFNKKTTAGYRRNNEGENHNRHGHHHHHHHRPHHHHKHHHHHRHHRHHSDEE
jgi:predicted Zn-dependent protease